jgi:hypothetical protein
MTESRQRHTAPRLAVLGGVVGAFVAFSVPAFASAVPPKITPSEVTFAIPAGSTSTWTLNLWSHSVLEGSNHGTSGVLTVPVPATSDCTFQADVTVVPVDGTRSFYSGKRATVPGCGPPQTIGGHVFLCNAAGGPTTTEISGGTLAASGPQTVGSQANPLGPIHVASGNYTMTATSPSGYVFVPCGGSATIGLTGASASELVDVPAGGSGVGSFYVVVAPTGSVGGGGSPGASGSNVGPSTSPGTPGPTSSLSKQSRPPATRVSSGSLAFTGMNVGPLLISGLLALVLGTLATATSRVRKRHAERSTARP